jgi:hypothetical protein
LALIGREQVGVFTTLNTSEGKQAIDKIPGKPIIGMKRNRYSIEKDKFGN